MTPLVILQMTGQHNLRRYFAMVQVYSTTFTNQLLLKLNQSKLDNWTANDSVCKAMGIDLEDHEKRATIFLKSFIFVDPSKPKLYLKVDINHNKKTFDIDFQYKDRVGHTRDGLQVKRKFARFPEWSWDITEKEYDKIYYAFKNSENYFEIKHKKAVNNPTIKSLYPKWLASRDAMVKTKDLSFETVIADRGRWNNHISSIEVNEYRFSARTVNTITRKDILNLRTTLYTTKASCKQKQGEYDRGDAVVNGILANLKSFFEWLEDEEILLTKNPVVRIPKNDIDPRTKTLGQEEIDRFMNYMLNDFKRASEKIRVAIYLQYYTGQRVNEVLQLKWSDLVINTKGQRVIYFQKKGRHKNLKKGKNTWFCILDDHLEAIFQTLPKLEGNPHIFWTNRNRTNGKQHISSSNLNAAINRACKELGMAKFGNHDIKRTIVTLEDDKYGRANTKLLTGNKSDKVLDKHYKHDFDIESQSVNPTLYKKMQEHQKERAVGINERIKFPTKKGAITLPTQKSNMAVGKRKEYITVGNKMLLDNQRRYKAKIKRLYGVSPSTYHKRKAAGYYDKAV